MFLLNSLSQILLAPSKDKLNDSNLYDKPMAEVIPIDDSIPDSEPSIGGIKNIVGSNFVEVYIFDGIFILYENPVNVKLLSKKIIQFTF